MKKGDKVRLKDGLVVNKKYGYLTFFEGMFFKGERKIVRIGNAILLRNNGFKYWYHPEMLELVTPDPS